MKKTTRTFLAGKALSEKIGQLKMSAPDRNYVFQTLAYSIQPLAFPLGGSDQLRNVVNQLQSLLYAA